MPEINLAAEPHPTVVKIPNTNLRQAMPDILKVLAILSVVYIHGSSLITYSESGFDLNAPVMQLAERALRFCVPIFIFLWAYFMEKSVIKRGRESVMPKFYSLFVPYLFWSVVYFLLLADFRHLGIAAIVTKHFSGYGWSGQYYFIILFQLVLLFPLITTVSQKLIKYVPWIFICGILFYAGLSYSGWFHVSAISKINDRVFIYWLPYAILGIIYAHRNIFSFQLPLYAGIILLAIIPAEIYWLHPQQVSLYLIPGVFISTMLLAGTLENKIDYESLPAALAKTVSMIARNTLGIFCLNPLVYTTLLPVLNTMNVHLQFPGASVVIPVFSTLLITSICLLIINLLKALKLGFLVAN